MLPNIQNRPCKLRIKNMGKNAKRKLTHNTRRSGAIYSYETNDNQV